MIKVLRLVLWMIIGFNLAILAACNSNPTVTETIQTIKITILADGKQNVIDILPGQTVQKILETANIILNNLDKVDPPTTTVITNPATIQITRIREKFEVEEKVIPFERKTTRNESLPEGQKMLIQNGRNGQQRITYRIVYENEIEISRTVVKTETTVEPLPEIIMVGVQAPYTSLPIPGKLVYITTGNAWLMEKNTGNRRPLVTTGDLDGRIFSLSDDQEWLLFSRRSDKKPEEEINTLWMVNLKGKNPKPVSLRVSNVVHFADWYPGAALSILYSTVEPRSAAPGWQANNDLQLLTVNPEGGILKQEEFLPANNGGIYGWWGTNFSWSPDGSALSYARPDGIGLVDLKEKQLIPLVTLPPYQTRSEWAWVPPLGWSPDHKILYSLIHSPAPGQENPESSPLFDLTAVTTTTPSTVIPIISQTGMFSYPIPSHPQSENQFMIAYLQAIFPEQSDTSRYRLMIMDQDGSNRRIVFPPEGSQGIEPQAVVWGPRPGEGANQLLAFIYQGNMVIMDTSTTESNQITGDGSISRLDWK